MRFFQLTLGRRPGAWLKWVDDPGWHVLDYGPDMEAIPRLKVGGGKRLWDLIHTDSLVYVVSRRFIDALQMNQLSGWKSYPVQIESN